MVHGLMSQIMQKHVDYVSREEPVSSQVIRPVGGSWGEQGTFMQVSEYLKIPILRYSMYVLGSTIPYVILRTLPYMK